MTSHQDVAVVVARLRTVEYFSDGLMAARTESDADLIDRLRAERKEAASLLESQAKALSEAEDNPALLSDPISVHINMCRGTIAKPSWENLRHLFPAIYDLEHAERRRLAAEARLAEARKVIERDIEALTEADTQIEYLHDKFKPTGSGNNAIARIDIALTAARAFTNAAKEKTNAVG